MSKFAILKELADIKALAQRKSMLKRGAVVAALAYLLVGYGSGAWSYVSTATNMLTEKVRSKVPLEFELERAKTMITGLIPDVRQNMMTIAQEEVGVADLRRQIEQSDAELNKQRGDLVKLRAALSSKSGAATIGNRKASKDDVKEELSRRFGRYQVAESTLASQRQLLAARETALDAARTKLNSMLNSKRDFEVQVKNLEARMKTQQGRTVASTIEVNDTQVGRCQGLLNDVRARLEVADRLFNCEGDVTAMISTLPPSTEDIGEQIDHYFSPSSKDGALAANQH